MTWKNVCWPGQNVRSARIIIFIRTTVLCSQLLHFEGFGVLQILCQTSFLSFFKCNSFPHNFKIAHKQKKKFYIFQEWIQKPIFYCILYLKQLRWRGWSFSHEFFQINIETFIQNICKVMSHRTKWKKIYNFRANILYWFPYAV